MSIWDGSSAELSFALFAIRIASPSLVLLSTLSLIPTRPPKESPSEITSVVVAKRIPRRALILFFLSLSALTYFLDGFTFVIYAVLDKVWPHLTGIEIGAVLGLLAFGGMAVVGAWKDVKGVEVWLLKRVKFAVALALLLDIAQVVLYVLNLGILDPDGPKLPKSSGPFPVDIPVLLHFAFPALRVLLLIPLFTALILPRVAYTPVAFGETVEAATPSDPLLRSVEEGAAASAGLSPLTSTKGNQYGTFRSGRSLVPGSSGQTTRAHTPAPSHVGVPPAKDSPSKQEVNLDPSWREIRKRIGRITPYLWPTKSFGLQLLAFFCVVIVIIGRFVNAVLPLILGELLYIFEEGSDRSPWPYLLAYVGLKFLQGSGGLAAVRDVLWAPVMQYSDREMSQLAFDHLLNLSLAFHTRRKTGEVLRILDRGSAINRSFELLLFNILPTFFDLVIALGIFIWKFDWTLAVVIFLVMFAYVLASVILTRWRTKLRRQMNDRDIVTRGIHTDCLLNYETVKYFNGEQHEGERYREAIREYQGLEYKVIASLNLLNLIQNLIITLGLLIGSIIVALRVVNGDLHASYFVVFITYLGQLYGPLNALGWIYRSINQSLVDAEKLLRLLNEPTDVNDKPNAPDLIVTNGEIEFDNVSFSYDGRTTALNGVSFKVPKGSSVALVGESGSGKSTILRLLYRFYDLNAGEGRILIDGQDIRDVTQASLRKAIGVVPQDTVLFNDSIAYNIGYGKFGASREEIEVAAKAAQMHDRILSFPDGYETKVGERGVRLSGGEKQRVAIARTLLKNPPVLLLDEATSALDTSTEKDIQKALQNLVEGRSSLSIAHRLSTIASADIILVLRDGQIVEQGDHADLLARGGIFASMWADQISSTEVPSAGAFNKEAVSGYALEPEAAGKLELGNTDKPGTSEEPAPEAADGSAPEVPITGPLEETPVPENESGKQLEPKLEDIAAVSAEGGDAAALILATEESADQQAGEAVPLSESPTPVTFADEQATRPTPISFPRSDDDSQQSREAIAQSPGVTFVGSPSRSASPNPESPKRKRISSQNFQRLARRISTGNRQPSGSTFAGITIPGLKREQSSPVASSAPSREERVSRAEGSTDSPAPSIQSESQKGIFKKKDKKDKEKKRTLDSH